MKGESVSRNGREKQRNDVVRRKLREIGQNCNFIFFNYNIIKDQLRPKFHVVHHSLDLSSLLQWHTSVLVKVYKPSDKVYLEFQLFILYYIIIVTIHRINFY